MLINTIEKTRNSNSFNKLTSGLILIDTRINENKFNKWHTKIIKTN